MKLIENSENAEWKAVKKFTEDAITALQIKLESYSTEYETAEIRGKIAFARQILQLDQKSANIEVDAVKYDY